MLDLFQTLQQALLQNPEGRPYLDAIHSLPEHWRYVEPVMLYWGLVNDGGHNGHMWSSHESYGEDLPEYWALLWAGLAYYEADAFLELWNEALVLHDPERYAAAQDRAKQTESWEGFVDEYASGTDKYDDLDSRLYRAGGLEEIMWNKIEPDLHLFGNA